MSSFIDSLLKEAPWLRPIMAWSIALLIIFVTFTIPAYFIFWPFFVRARTEIAKFAEKLAQQFRTNRRERGTQLDAAADQYLHDGGLWRLKSEARGQWTALVKRIVRDLDKLREPLHKAAESLQTLQRSASALEKTLKRSNASDVSSLPKLPTSEEIVGAAGGFRVAVVLSILLGLILLGLMSVNTGMLSQILRDLGFVPASSMFAGVRLATIFAFVLTLIEAGIGVAHGATSHTNRESLSLAPIVAIVLGMILAFVEGFFYSKIAPQGTFQLPFTTYEMPQNNVLFLYGFTLVTILFVLGSIFFANIHKALHGTAAGTLRRQMRKLERRNDALNRSAQRCDEMLKTARTTGQNIEDVLQGPARSSMNMRQQLERVIREITTFRDVVPEWAKDHEPVLTRSEVHSLALRAGLWLTLATAGIIVMIITGLNSFEAFNPNLKVSMLWVFAVGQSILFLGVGCLLGAGETVVQGSGTERRVWAAPRFTTWCAYVVGGSLVISYIALFFTVASRLGLGGVWFCDLVVGLFLIAAGYQLGPLLNVARLWLARVSYCVLNGLEITWLALVRVLHFVLVILENVAYLLAAPVDRLLRLLVRSRGARADRQSNEREASPISAH